MTAPRRRQHDDDVRRRLLFSLALAVLVHAGLFAVLIHWTRARPTSARPEQSFMQLRLIETPLKATQDPAPDETPGPQAPRAPDAAAPARSAPASSQRAHVGPRRLPAAVDRRDVVAPSAPTAADPTTPVVSAVAASASAPITDAPSVRIFRRDGSIDLPDTDSSGADPARRDPAAFGLRKRVAPYSPDPMVHRSPLPYAPTPFEPFWVPRDETLLGEWVRKATRSTSWETQGGTRISCTAFLFFGGCGWGPAPRVSIEELKRMRADPPMPRPAPSLPASADKP